MGPQVFQTRPCANPSSEKSRSTSQRRPYTRPGLGAATGSAAAAGAASRLLQTVPGAGPSAGPRSGCRSSSLLQPEPMATRDSPGPCPTRSGWPPTSPAQLRRRLEEAETEAASEALRLGGRAWCACAGEPGRLTGAAALEKAGVQGWDGPPGAERRSGAGLPEEGRGGIGKAGRSAAEPG